MAKQEKDTLYVIAAAYDDVDDAVADYEAVKRLYREVRTSHEFDAATSCPVCRNDSSQLTWPVFACPKGAPCGVPDFTKCESESWGPGCGAVANPDAGVECGALP